MFFEVIHKLLDFLLETTKQGVINVRSQNDNQLASIVMLVEDTRISFALLQSHLE
jgi:hypothetical protein